MVNRNLSKALVGLVALGAVALGVAHSELADVKSRGELRIVMSGEYPPFSQPGSGGALEGFDVDVGNELAKRLGVKPRIIKAEFSSIIAGIQAGNFDVAVASQSKTPERAKAVDFTTKPYYFDGAQLFVPKDSKATSLESLNGAPVAVALGTTFEKFLRERKYPNIVTFSGEQEIYLALGAGRVAGMVTTRTVGGVAIKKGQALKAAGPVLQQDNPYITFALNQPQLKAALDKALEDMRRDGTMKRISQKWLSLDVTTASR
jgi:ABC-type amino acid transport substrate-binding protein